MKSYVEFALAEAKKTLATLADDQVMLQRIADAGDALASGIAAGGLVYACGNGGSMCDAMHFAEELSGRYRRDRPPVGATAISDPGHLTCVSNDFGYEHVFSRYLEGVGRAGDVLLAISTSGNSLSVINAVRSARKLGIVVIGLHGKKDSLLDKLADFSIGTPSTPYADRVQECHIKVIHILIEIVERRLYPHLYVD
ncbi:MAG TPA: SIS domain-containing protein [Burkholderiaceae bacterium]|nr:SIS domain-containing protein [Burkholderiaceae bacterium]